jgi:hypothetical protein
MSHGAAVGGRLAGSYSRAAISVLRIPVLKMATSVALKQVSDRFAALRETELQGIPEEAAGEPEPEFAPAPAPTTVAAPVPQEARRFWSGQLVDRSGAFRRLSRFLVRVKQSR